MLEPKMGPEEPEADGRPWHGSSRARQTWGVLGQVLVVPTRVGQDGHGDMRGHPAHPAPPAPQDGQSATTTPPGTQPLPWGPPESLPCGGHLSPWWSPLSHVLQVSFSHHPEDGSACVTFSQPHGDIRRLLRFLGNVPTELRCSS